MNGSALFTAFLISFPLISCLLTLLHAYRMTGDAGIARLKEKHEKSYTVLQKWESRWFCLPATLLITLAIALLAAVQLSLPALITIHAWPVVPELIAWGVLFLTIYLFHMFLPIVLAESYADSIVFFSLPILLIFTRALYPLAWLLGRSQQALLDYLMSGSDEEHRPTPEDEIIALVDEADEKEMEEDERALIRSVFEFGDTVSREIMTPRVDVEGFEDTVTVEGCMKKVSQSTRSRFPVFHDTLDDIRGVVHVKQLLRCIAEQKHDLPLRNVCHKASFVPEAMPITDLMQLLMLEQLQVAIVVDEYGGTAGLITMEDIVEELVGEIQDEYDTEEQQVHHMPDGSVLVSSRLGVYELNERLGIEIPESEEYESIGGYIFHEMGRIPRQGEVLQTSEYQMTIQTATPNQILTVRIDRVDSAGTK